MAPSTIYLGRLMDMVQQPGAVSRGTLKGDLEKLSCAPQIGQIVGVCVGKQWVPRSCQTIKDVRTA